MESIILIILALVFGFLLMKSKTVHKESARKRQNLVDKIKQHDR